MSSDTNSPSDAPAAPEQKDTRSKLQKRVDELNEKRNEPLPLGVRRGIYDLIQAASADLPGAAANPNVQQKFGEEAFLALVNDKSKSPDIAYRHKATNSIGGIISLMQNGVLKRDDSLMARLNFDADNLSGILQAVFSKAKGKRITKEEVNDWLALNSDTWKPSMIMYRFGLACDDQSSQVEIKEKVDRLVSAFARLKELNGFYHQFRHLGPALRKLKEGRATIDEIMKKPPFEPRTQGERFDVQEIEKMLAEIDGNTAPDQNTGSATPQPTATPAPAAATPEQGIDYNEFCVENIDHPALISLRNLEKALRAAYEDDALYEANYKDQVFGGATDEEVLDALNNAFEVQLGLGDRLLMATTQGGKITALIKGIAEAYQLEGDDEGLKNKLSEIHDKLVQLYPELVPGNQANASTSTAPDSGQAPDFLGLGPQIDYLVFLNEMQSKPETAPFYWPLYHLYFALKADEATYNRDWKDQHFGGLSKDQLNLKIDELTSPGFSFQLAQAAVNGPYTTALIEEIAHYYALDRDPEGLKRKMDEFHKLFGAAFPGSLHEEDPYRQTL